MRSAERLELGAQQILVRLAAAYQSRFAVGYDNDGWPEREVVVAGHGQMVSTRAWYRDQIIHPWHRQSRLAYQHIS